MAFERDAPKAVRPSTLRYASHTILSYFAYSENNYLHIGIQSDTL